MFKLVTPPTVEPITLDDAKTFLRIEAGLTADDNLITALITAARSACEEYTGRAFITQVWEKWFDEWPACRRGGEPWWDGVRQGPISLITGGAAHIHLPRPPLQSLVKISTYADDGTETQFDDASAQQVIVDTISDPGRISLKIGASWPVAIRGSNAIQIRFKAGYGDAAANVPQPIIQAMCLLIGHWYENRSVFVDSRLAEIPYGIRMLLDRYRVLGI